MGFHKVLIANRGEIALRVQKACAELGLATVAVFSDADCNAPFVRAAGEAVHIGAAPALASYLNQDAVIQAAKQTGADAIHPGYGFLSENASFAARCEKEGITFVGPTADSITKMGSKIGAKELLQRVAPSIPLIPGYQGSDQSIPTLIAQAEKVGFPILVKASAGGGGKGMRVVRERAALRDAIEGAQREAKSAFGDSSLLIERYFEDVRHIEVQIIGDTHGNVIHCFERECSVQRRHQKVIEETPSVAITDSQRHQIGQYAVTIGKSLKYVGLGTVEFIFDNISSQFFFLEVNTRLQVEHPVTEAVTGLDLVRTQLLIAMGRSLASLNLTQPGSDAANVVRRGHAIEARLCAEDAANGFVPCAGTIAAWRTAPASSAFELHPASGVRYDAGYGTGSTVSIYYDNLLAKVIAYADTREEAAQRLDAALRDTVVLGLDTNLPLLRAILQHPAFAKAQVNTHFIPTHQAQLLHREHDAVLDRNLAIVAMVWGWLVRQNARTLLRHVPSMWRNNTRKFLEEKFKVGEKDFAVYYNAVHDHAATNHTPQRFDVRVGADEVSVTLCAHRQIAEVYELDVQIDAQTQHYLISSPHSIDQEDRYHTSLPIFIHNARAGNRTVVAQPRFPARGDDAGAHTVMQGRYCAPMPGKVVRVCVQEGERVRVGQVLAVLEAMKMENSINAVEEGVVARVAAKEGDLVNVKALLVEVTKE
eukprot:Phypoly_transcript_04287.p1 GENE.Phypoly_transcript_04287~~Phypoly_transcript_04287.p1  ORF type:complete len:714 (-),score=175.73 Phypoly_transcript_04287:81-2201(-)